MNRRRLLRGLAVVPGLAVGMWRAAVRGEDSAAEKVKAESHEADLLATGEVVHWEFRLRDPRGTKLAVEQLPVLRWTNPASGRVYGSVFLATAGGRPEAVFAVYKWYDPWHGFEAEMQSVSLSGLEAKRDGEILWHPGRPGIELRDIPGAPAPANAASGRQRQLGAMAKRFSAHLLKQIQQEEEPLLLRLLTKPIIRYQQAAPMLVPGPVRSTGPCSRSSRGRTPRSSS